MPVSYLILRLYHEYFKQAFWVQQTDGCLWIVYKEEKEEMTRLETKRLILRPFTEKDVKDVYEYARDPEVTEYLIWEPHSTEEETAEIIESLYTGEGFFALEEKSLKKCIGCFEFRVIPQHQKAGFGCVLNRDFWGKGYMSEALEAVLSLAFNTLKLNRVESTCYRGNAGSGRVMEKCGMSFEGTGSDELFIKGRFVDVHHYGITQKEYFRQNNNKNRGEYLKPESF